MPMISVQLGTEPSAEIARAAAQIVTDLTASVLHKEKAAYVAAIFSALSDLLGGVHPESYVHADDVRADAYGFGGFTQERRYIESRLPHEALAATGS